MNTNNTLNQLSEVATRIKELREIIGFSVKEMTEKTGKSRRTVSRMITELKEKNIIARVGSDKNGYWEIVNREKCEKYPRNIRKNVIFNSKNTGKM